MKKRNEKKSVRMMETYIKVVEAESNQFATNNGLLTSENLDVRENNSVLSEMVMLLIRFIKEADNFDGEGFKQYILTVENERLKKTLENLSNEVNLGGV